MCLIVFIFVYNRLSFICSVKEDDKKTWLDLFVLWHRKHSKNKHLSTLKHANDKWLALWRSASMPRVTPSGPKPHVRVVRFQMQISSMRYLPFGGKNTSISWHGDLIVQQSNSCLFFLFLFEHNEINCSPRLLVLTDNLQHFHSDKHWITISRVNDYYIDEIRQVIVHDFIHLFTGILISGLWR